MAAGHGGQILLSQATRSVIEDDVLPAFLDYYERFAGFGFWAAVEKSTGEFVGWFHFRPLDSDLEEIELALRKVSLHVLA